MYDDDLFTVEDVQSWLSSPVTKFCMDILKKRVQDVKDNYIKVDGAADFERQKGLQEGYERSLGLMMTLAKDIASGE